MEDGLGKERQNVAPRREQTTLYRNRVKNDQREEKKHSNAKEPYKSSENKQTESLRTDSLVKEGTSAKSPNDVLITESSQPMY